MNSPLLRQKEKKINIKIPVYIQTVPMKTAVLAPTPSPVPLLPPLKSTPSFKLPSSLPVNHYHLYRHHHQHYYLSTTITTNTTTSLPPPPSQSLPIVVLLTSPPDVSGLASHLLPRTSPASRTSHNLDKIPLITPQRPA